MKRGIVDRLGYAVLWIGLATIEVLHWCSDQWCNVFHNDVIELTDLNYKQEITAKYKYCGKCGRKWGEEDV